MLSRHMCVLAFVCLILLGSCSASDPRIVELKARGQKEGWTFQVAEQFEEHATGYIHDDKALKSEMFVTPTAVRDLPRKFDWRDETPGGLQPIKNQKSCGSCWAFGTVASLESIIKIRDGVTAVLSEQQLVSCNSKGWSCGGGQFAHAYHLAPKGASEESQFPYVAKDVKCKTGLNYVSNIQNWGYLGNGSYPSNEQIKQAIYQYGPVGVTVAASRSFQNYKGGIYNANDSNSTNHITNIVGWNEDEGYWIMRNSWGTSWGEQGYMRIKYRVNRIGENTTFVDYKAACRPQPLAYVGDNQTIKVGESVRLGGMALPEHTYRWSPADSLNDPNIASPLGTPSQDTVYKLRVTNACGTAEKSVTIKVMP